MILHLHAKTQSILHSTHNNILFPQVCWHQAHLSRADFQLASTSTSLVPRISDTSLVPSQVYPKTTLSWDDPSRTPTRNWSSSLVPSQVYPKMTLSKRTFTYPQWIIGILASFPDWDFPTHYSPNCPLPASGDLIKDPFIEVRMPKLDNLRIAVQVEVSKTQVSSELA